MKVIRQWVRRCIDDIRRRLARRWLLRRLDRIGMPRSESEKLVAYMLDNAVILSIQPEEVMPRQWGIRVGSKVTKNEKGFLALPPLGMWALWATIAMGWAMIMDIAYKSATAPERWF